MTRLDPGDLFIALLLLSEIVTFVLIDSFFEKGEITCLLMF